MYNNHFDPIINLKQGKEFLKYGTINKINSIQQLHNLQKTTSSELDSIDYTTSDSENYKILDSYKNVSDYKAYANQKELFNKTVSEYMLTHTTYLNDPGNNRIVNTLMNLNKKLINQATKISKMLTNIHDTDSNEQNQINRHIKEIDDSIYYLKKNIDIIKPLEKRNTETTPGILLSEWYKVVGLGIIILLTILVLTSKIKQKNNIIMFSFFTIVAFILTWLSRHIIL
ncbi:hypothetical protein OAA07_00355 [bacterium]|nr:hypothetical protein [bacterium]